MPDPLPPSPPERDASGRRRLVHHTPLRPYSPYSSGERKQARDYIDGILGFPTLTAGVVAVLVWFYLVQLVFGWPLVFGFPGDLPLQDELVMEAVGSRLGWLDREAVLRGEWFRLVAATLLHGSVLHLAGNAFVLYFLGRLVENLHGRAGFAASYVGGGVAGAALSMTLSDAHSLGASGAILSLLGVLISYGLRHRRLLPIPLADSFRLDLWFFAFFAALLSALPGVDWAGHLGGFLFGLAFGGLWPPVAARPVGPARVALGAALAASALLCVGIMGVRVWQMSRWVPAHEIRALRDALDAGDLATADRLARSLATTLPDSDSLQYLRVAVLLGSQQPDEALALLDAMASDRTSLLPLRIEAAFLAGRPEKAVAAVREQERRAPREFARAGQGDNALAWGLFLARPDERAAVQEGMRRVRRALRVQPDERAYRNTLALGLVLDRQPERARVLLGELMAGRSRAEQKDDVFILVLALADLGRTAEAEALYDDYAAEFPDGALRAEAEERLRRKGTSAP